MDECYGISMENVKHGKKGVKKATAHGKVPLLAKLQYMPCGT